MLPWYGAFGQKKRSSIKSHGRQIGRPHNALFWELRKVPSHPSFNRAVLCCTGTASWASWGSSCLPTRPWATRRAPSGSAPASCWAAGRRCCRCRWSWRPSPQLWLPHLGCAVRPTVRPTVCLSVFHACVCLGLCLPVTHPSFSSILVHQHADQCHQLCDRTLLCALICAIVRVQFLKAQSALFWAAGPFQCTCSRHLLLTVTVARLDCAV
jgi:hypothetical protein